MRTWILLVLVVGLASTVWAGGVGDAVEVSIQSDCGRELPLYRVPSARTVHRAYAEAVKGEQYRIVVQNRLNRRVGVVVAVDGRNIISGKKSWLGSRERMYILEPYGSGEFTGWRTAQNQVNRFYFTDMADSYAAAFKDESAMGVIAVAVYPEVTRCEVPAALSSAAPAPRAKGAAADSAAREESAGTGYGRVEYSPTQVVEFASERRAAEKVYLKYEWRSTLCRMGVIACSTPLPRNRMWSDNGYAPPPPR